MVIRNAYLITKDYYAAEDICQETFVRFSDRLAQVPDESVRSWLLHTSRRLALDYRRNEERNSARIEYMARESGLEEQADTRYFDLSDLLEECEKIQAKKETLLLLKEQRPLWYQVLLMSRVEGMRNGAIGLELDVTASLVSKWKERAGRWLRERYEKDYLDAE
ncbi:MAG: sigma-70 family RNA polymerase sigma factor [Lachnospiraceae bacterium]|nr:sigma-70 family RNA polymerase sigma factor [Lachnospiraceae bacterium]